MPQTYDIGVEQMFQLYPNKDNIDKKVFKSIIDEFNQEVINQVIDGGIFLMPHRLGVYAKLVKEKQVKKSKVNGKYMTHILYHESKLNKKRIIAEGKTPLEVYKDENGKIIGDNGGTPWLLFSTDDISWTFRWTKLKRRSTGKLHIRNSEYYTLVAARGSVRALGKKKRESQ